MYNSFLRDYSVSFMHLHLLKSRSYSVYYTSLARVDLLMNHSKHDTINAVGRTFTRKCFSIDLCGVICPLLQRFAYFAPTPLDNKQSA